MFMMVAVHAAPSTCTFNVRWRFCTFAQIRAKIHRMGIEPMFPPWKGSVLTTWPTVLEKFWATLTTSVVSLLWNHAINKVGDTIPIVARKLLRMTKSLLHCLFESRIDTSHLSVQSGSSLNWRTPNEVSKWTPELFNVALKTLNTTLIDN